MIAAIGAVLAAALTAGPGPVAAKSVKPGTAETKPASAPAAAPVEAAVPAAMPVVTWRAPPGCPTEGEVGALVVKALGGAPPERAVRAELLAEPLLGGRWRLHARGIAIAETITDGCASLAEAAARAIAQAARPGATIASSDGAAAGVDAGPVVATPRPTSATSPVVTPPPPKVPPARKRWGLLQLAGGIGLGILRSPFGVLRASGGVMGDKWSVGLTQVFYLPSEMRSPSDPSVGGKMWLWATGVRACAIPVRQVVEVNMCAGLEAGAVTGRGIGAVEVSRRQTAGWMALTGGVASGLLIGKRLVLTAGMDLVGVVVRPHFTVDGSGEVCCGTLGLRALAGLQVRLP